MKTKLLSLVLIAFTALQINAQCDRTGSLSPTADPTNYPVTGTANIIFTDTGDRMVEFGSDFDTVQGLDLRVFLSTDTSITNSGGSHIEITTSPLVDDNGNPGNGTNDYLGDPMTETRTIPISQTIDIEDYDYVIIQCTVANMQWGRAQFGAPSAGCSTLSTDQNTFSESISLFPNPANEQFEVRNELEAPISIAVYDVLGKRIQSIENTKLKNQTVSLSNLNSGVYLVEIKSDTQRIIKKLIKR